MAGYFMLTVDVEDWFQVENFKAYIPRSAWPACELRVEENTHRILDILDEAGEKVGATFFILGWLAKRLPGLVREIARRGHEVASHGYHHNLCTSESPAVLESDLRDSKALLEDIIAGPVDGYRAPSFSVSDEVLDTLERCGYRYDSSFNSFGMNKRYGKIRLDAAQKRGVAFQREGGLWELPLSNLTVGQRTVPMSGGGYFRLYPFPLFRGGVRRVLDAEGAYLFYMHPWEVDPGQPRVRQASALSRFRHYLNLGKTGGRLSTLLGAFSDCRFVSCRDYIETVSQNASPISL